MSMYAFELIFVNRSLAITQNIKFQAIACYEVLKGFIFKIGNICRTNYLPKQLLTYVQSNLKV